MQRYNNIDRSTMDNSCFFPFEPPPPIILPPPPPPPPAATAVTSDHTNKSNRAQRKDRHSKIRTAQGLRDRRMRLSLEVAPEFFDIQDMLGFDKPSKTLRWLITAAKPAINDIISSSTSSTTKSSSFVEDQDDSSKSVVAMKPALAVARKSRLIRTAAAPAAAGVVGRDSRIEARARARERTERKKRSLLLLQQQYYSSTTTTTNCSVAFDQDSSSTTDRNDQEQEELAPVTIFDYEWEMERMVLQNQWGNH